MTVGRHKITQTDFLTSFEIEDYKSTHSLLVLCTPLFIPYTVDIIYYIHCFFIFLNTLMIKPLLLSSYIARETTLVGSKLNVCQHNWPIH